jgi:transcriptional regulator with XRE-family HTH domain
MTESEVTQEDLSARLREVREYLGLSQQFVCDQTGIPRSAVSDIERGVRRVDSLELQRLAKLYRYPVNYFLGVSPAEESDALAALRAATEDLDDQDLAEVVRFASFLRTYGRAETRRPTGGQAQ